MNSKGYTLIELLATISILSIVCYIVYVKLTGVYDSASQEAFKTSVSEIMEVVSLEMADSNLNPESLNNKTVNEIFDMLNIKNNKDRYENISFVCTATINNLCTKFSIYVVGKNEWKGYIVSGTKSNLIVEKV